MPIDVQLQILDQRYHTEWGLPKYSTPGSAGLDIRAAIEDSIVLHSNKSQLIPSGLKIWIDNPDYVLFLLPRSGLGSRGLILGNSTGVIDSDYQGEIKINVWNRIDDLIIIEPGQLICQAVLLHTTQMNLMCVDEFSNNTHRGENGFGSSGIK